MACNYRRAHGAEGYTKRVPVQTAAGISGCTPDEVRRFRQQVLPRPPGSVTDVEMFSSKEVVAMAAGHVADTWRTTANVDQLVARLALRDSNARDWVAVYGHGRASASNKPRSRWPYVVPKRVAVFDPTEYYEAFDAATKDETPPQ